MTTNQTQVDFFNYNPEEVEAPNRESRFLTKVPEESKAIICKIVPNPRYANGKSWYHPIRQFVYVAGPNPEKDKRTKACMSFFDERSPENDAYWTYKKEFSALKRLGKGNSVEAKKLEDLSKTFQPKDGGWILFVEPNSPTIRALKLPISAIHCLTGKDATEYKPAIPSLIKAMASDGLSPFDIRKNKPKLGWIRIYKTGEGLATRYVVEAVKHEVLLEDKGKKFKASDYTELDVHEKFLTGQVTLEDFPDVVEYERKHAWTVAECDEYTKSLGTVVPERFLKKSNEGRVDETDENDQSKTVNSLAALDSLLPSAPKAVSSDEIPF